MTETLALDLARAQFAFTISFHIIFPAITIGPHFDTCFARGLRQAGLLENPGAGILMCHDDHLAYANSFEKH